MIQKNKKNIMTKMNMKNKINMVTKMILSKSNKIMNK
jgi:hypothetical protein